MALKPTEYGGSDTDKTRGIQPAPHVTEAFEELRLIAQSDPDIGELNRPTEISPPRGG